MNLKEAWQNSLRILGRLFLANAVTLLCRSLNVKIVNEEPVKKLKDENKNYIVAFWHGTMLYPWYLHGSSSFAALTSKSKDGDLLAKLLRHWDYEVIRGSSSSGGDIALGIIVEYAKNNYSIAITPDGPRGPAYKLKAGAVVAAKKTGIPIVLAGVGYKKKKILKNWDKFEIPHFFSNANVVYSDPVSIDKDLSYEETSEKIIECENKLNELQRQAQEFDL
jgi:lysophospholipid acyltransferase (LPLAT)-like uncharacterized protein